MRAGEGGVSEVLKVSEGGDIEHVAAARNKFACGIERRPCVEHLGDG